MKAPWKFSPHARTCKECGSQRPGMQPLRLEVDGKVVRGYWHLKCFEKAKQKAKPDARAGDRRAQHRREDNGRTN